MRAQQERKRMKESEGGGGILFLFPFTRLKRGSKNWMQEEVKKSKKNIRMREQKRKEMTKIYIRRDEGEKKIVLTITDRTCVCL